MFGGLSLLLSSDRLIQLLPCVNLSGFISSLPSLSMALSCLRAILSAVRHRGPFKRRTAKALEGVVLDLLALSTEMVPGILHVNDLNVLREVNERSSGQ